MQTKVFWSNDEKFQVASRAALLIHTGRVSRQLDAINEAQLELPEHRRRPLFKTVSGLEWFSVALADQTRRLTHVPETAQAEKKTDSSQVVVDKLADILVRVLAVPAVADSIRSLLMGSVLAEIAAPVAEDQPAPSQVKKPRVLIVGLLGMQEESVRQMFANKFDLRFKDAECRSAEMKSAARSVDHVIGMVGFMGHNQDKILKLAHADYRRVSNGVPSLKQTLQNIREAI